MSVTRRCRRAWEDQQISNKVRKCWLKPNDNLKLFRSTFILNVLSQKREGKIWNSSFISISKKMLALTRMRLSWVRYLMVYETVFFCSGASRCSEDEPHLQRPPLHVRKWVLPRWRVALPYRTQDCGSGSEEIKMKRYSDEKAKDTLDTFDFLRMACVHQWL